MDCRPDKELEEAQRQAGAVADDDYPAFKERAQATMRRARADDDAQNAAAAAATAAADVEDVRLEIATSSSVDADAPPPQKKDLETRELLRALRTRLLPRSRTSEGLIAEQWEETWQNFKESRDPEGERMLRQVCATVFFFNLVPSAGYMWPRVYTHA